MAWISLGFDSPWVHQITYKINLNLSAEALAQAGKEDFLNFSKGLFCYNKLMRFPTFAYETKKIKEGFLLVAGADEVGIGPLAGPVVAACVILNPENIGKRADHKWWRRIRDSKTVREKERNELNQFIKENCLDFGVGVVSCETVDEINVLQSAILAVKQSVEALKKFPDFLFVDGIHKIKSLPVPQESIIGGDSKVLSIAAASIVAKVARDKILSDYHELYPQYGFLNHKGYLTKRHKQAILEFGVLPIHRKSFAFVKQCLNHTFVGPANTL